MDYGVTTIACVHDYGVLLAGGWYLPISFRKGGSLQLPGGASSQMVLMGFSTGSEWWVAIVSYAGLKSCIVAMGPSDKYSLSQYFGRLFMLMAIHY